MRRKLRNLPADQPVTTWRCPQCEAWWPIEPHEFPLHCLCGRRSEDGADGLWGQAPALAVQRAAKAQAKEHARRQRQMARWRWGDWLAYALALCGVTEPRVLWAINAARRLRGLAPLEDCGCQQRQETLNRWGWQTWDWFRRRAERISRIG